MKTRLTTALLGASLLMAPGMLAAQPAAAEPATVSAQPQFVQDSMNVFRRFAPEHTAKMVEFYGKVLGLQPLRPITLSPNQQVILFRVGSGQIKLAAGLQKTRKYHPGGMNDATGIRLYTLFFPDEAALAVRFKAAGYPAPRFKAIGEGKRAALVKDPGDFTLELVIVPNASPDTYGKIEIGINVTDLDRSAAFYRDFAGLDALPPVKDAFLGVTKHPYRHGTTTINLWSTGKPLPADTGSAGIQYVIRNIDAVDANAKARNVTVETPLGGVPGFNVRTVWLNDPDGATNYFYQMGAPGNVAK